MKLRPFKLFILVLKLAAISKDTIGVLADVFTAADDIEAMMLTAETPYDS